LFGISEQAASDHPDSRLSERTAQRRQEKTMKRETYERALRSAAQISFLALPFAVGCGNTFEPIDPTPVPGDGDGDGDGDDYRGDGSGDAYGDDGSDGTSDDGASDDGSGDDGASDDSGDGSECADSGTPFDCATALKDAYPNGDPNWYNSQDPTPRVDTGVSVEKLVECCSTLAAAPDAYLTFQDTGCCSLHNETDGAVANVGIACTPWGPPMPRAMRRPEVLS
jgi:hypothetical protein